MRNGKKLIAALAVLSLAAAACGGVQKQGAQDTGGTGKAGEVPKGGVLLLAMNGDVCNTFDPQRAYCSLNWEFQRIMTRTLLSTNGQESVNGGTELQPDLAAEMPTVSEDGLTWTFKLKPNIHYAPPLQDTVVTSQDFVRTMMREADPESSRGGYSFYYTAIEGFKDFGAGKAKTISGLETPDDSTLIFHLSVPSGDLGYRLAMGAASPIPPNPADPSAPLGIAEGHTKDFGRFQVATGPYMFEGSENMTFTGDAAEDTPATGYEPDRAIHLVRNPSYDAATDGLRPAYVDEIQVEIGATVEEIALKVDNGEVDAGWDASYTTDQLHTYQDDPALSDRVHITEIDATGYASMNVAEPPFDDIHVRKAMNLVLDKEAVNQLGGGPSVGEIATHVFPNGLTGNINTEYNPYPSPDNKGDLEAAKAEMMQSAYDSNGDGVCDDPSCEAVLTVAYQADPRPKQVASMADSYAQIGVILDVKYTGFGGMYDKCEEPTNHIAFCPTLAWSKDYPDAYTFAPPLFGSEALYGTNLALLGATPDQLKEWGYTVDSVPSVDEPMKACEPLSGEARVKCYADFDRFLMEEVVPWIPTRYSNNVDIVSARLANYTEDSWTDLMSLDHVAVGQA